MTIGEKNSWEIYIFKIISLTDVGSIQGVMESLVKFEWINRGYILWSIKVGDTTDILACLAVISGMYSGFL